MGRPLAHVPDQVGDCHASYARHHAQTFIDVFAGLGIHPDRYYWMSDIYPTGDVDPFIRTALDRAQVVRDVYRRVSKVERPEGWLPVQAVCPVCGKVGTTIALDWDGETVRVECRPDYVTWAHGCGFVGPGLPVRRDRQALLEPRVGRPVEPLRGDDRAVRQGPRHGRRLARSVGRDRPRGLRPRAARSTSPTSSSTSAGARCRPRRDGAPRPTQIVEVLPPEPLRLLFLRPRPNQAIEFDPEGTDAIPRLFDELDRLAAAVAGRPYRGELPLGPGAPLRLRPGGRRARRRGRRRLPARLRPPRPPGPDPRRGHRGPSRGGEGRAAHARARMRGPRRAARRRPRLAGRLRAGERDRQRPPRRTPQRGRGPRRGPARLPRRPRHRGRRRSDPHGGDAWQALLFRVAGDAALPSGRAFGAVYLAFLGRPNGPRAGWLLASLEPTFVIARLRAAAGWHDHAGDAAASGDEAASGEEAGA